MDIPNLVQTVLIYALPVLFAITVHEAAHGYVARYLGDNTAYAAGRVTLNPFSHIDPMGTILMPLMLYFATSGAFLFGYAKPVPVNFGALRHPKRDMVWVALAGPASNFIQAILWAIGLAVLGGSGVEERFFIEMCAESASARRNFVFGPMTLTTGCSPIVFVTTPPQPASNARRMFDSDSVGGADESRNGF